jgi:dihydroorotase
MINRNHMLVGGIRPHYYCLPVAKRSTHRLALRRPRPRAIRASSSAPTARRIPTRNKESACGCAGVFSATNTISCLAHVFEEEGALDRLEGFASLHGPARYGLPERGDDHAGKARHAGDAYPAKIDTGAGPVTVFDPGHPLHWHVVTLNRIFSKIRPPRSFQKDRFRGRP